MVMGHGLSSDNRMANLQRGGFVDGILSVYAVG